MHRRRRAHVAAVLGILVASIPEAHVVQSDPGPSGAIHEIVTECATATMVVRADATAVRGPPRTPFTSQTTVPSSRRRSPGGSCECQR